MKRVLIVHGDDLGLSKAINDGILQAHRHGILTSTSIMAGGIAFKHALQLRRSATNLDLGVHLSLVGEAPSILPAKQIPSLVDAEGHFHPHAMDFIKVYLRRAIDLNEVRREWTAQITRILDAGISPSHLDSHQHLHALPALRRIAEELARRFDIPAIRFPCERPCPYMLRRPDKLPRLAQLLVLNALWHLNKEPALIHADHFIGFFLGGQLDSGRLHSLLADLPEHGSSELMCHPGYPDPHSPQAHWGYQHEAELKALADPATLDAVKHLNIELINYWNLVKAGGKI